MNGALKVALARSRSECSKHCKIRTNNTFARTNLRFKISMISHTNRTISFGTVRWLSFSSFSSLSSSSSLSNGIGDIMTPFRNENNEKRNRKSKLRHNSGRTLPSASVSSSSSPSSSLSSSSSSPPVLLYTGPFAGVTLRLKRVSVTTAVLGLVGIPYLMFAQNVDATAAKAAVGGTALLAGVGSTCLLHYCFSPYVHTLVTSKATATSADADNDNPTNTATATAKKATTSDDRPPPPFSQYVTATTRNIFAREVETTFDLTADVTSTRDTQSMRPFCSFYAKGIPMYVHKELIEHEWLKEALFGRESADNDNNLSSKTKRNDDDDNAIF